MSEARINGKPASLAAAAECAAGILSQARMPVVAGLGTDVAGARAAILLAEKLGGAYDHMHAARIFAGLDVMRQAGWMFTTPSEARLRADVLLFVGKDLSKFWPAMMACLSPAEKPPFELAREPRKILWIGPGRGGAQAEGFTVQTLDSPDLKVTLAALRARVGGRAVHAAKSTLKKLDEFTSVLKNARFGVAVWGGEELDSLSVEMLQGLIRDLNKSVRFSGLPIDSGANASGVVQTSGWMTGFPVRTSFGRGFPEHDTWRFDATRMIESGEADAALWISAYEGVAPRWKRNIPLIALASAQTAFSKVPQVCVDVGCPGIDHDGVEFAQETGSLVARTASHPSHKPQVAAVIEEIVKYLGGDASC
jgi:formylmethanofuran dehydrogenase subunit B